MDVGLRGERGLMYGSRKLVGVVVTREAVLEGSCVTRMEDDM